MSIADWNAGIIRPVAVAPTGPFQNGAAPGVWTLDQVAYWVKQGLWPTAGLSPNYIEDIFSTYLYTGTSATQPINNGVDLAGKGGLVWLKKRNAIGSHALFDTARGVSAALYSEQDRQQDGPYAGYGVSAFNASGFDLGGMYPADINSSGNTFASWTFRKQPKFFDVVTWTGDGVAGRQIPHNLGSVPGVIISKSVSNVESWAVYHRSLGPTQRIFLNLTNATGTASQFWNNTAPTATDFTVGAGSMVNASGVTYVAYLFAHDAGGFGLSGNENVISCGSYTGVTYPNSLEVTLGFEPQWVMIKNATTASGWAMWDVMRGMSVIPAANTAQALLLEPNTTAADSNQPGIYPTPTGFVVKNGLTSISGTGDTITYIAIRRGPMAVPTLGTTVFNPAFYGTNGIFGYLGAPTDMNIYTSLTTPAVTNPVLRSRLVGSGNRVTTSNSDAEVADATNFWDNMVGANPSGEVTAFNNTRITFNFRRAPSFFDEVCYTGTGVARTVAHNLAAVPELIIVKCRSNIRNWCTYSQGLGNGNQIILNSSAASESTALWNNTNPTSAVFSLNNDLDVNGSGRTYAAYLFATCAGVSKVGSYTGTGTTQAIACGFTAGARFVLIKRTDSTGDWYVWDSARGIVAGNDPYLLLNSSAAEVTGTDYIDTSAAGFEISSTAPAEINANGGSYIFFAVA